MGQQAFDRTVQIMDSIRMKNLEVAGFPRELSLVQKCKCAWCERTVNPKRFRDPESIKEFEMSGLCGRCMKAYFRTNPSPFFDTYRKNAYIALTRARKLAIFTDNADD